MEYLDLILAEQINIYIYIQVKELRQKPDDISNTTGDLKNRYN